MFTKLYEDLLIMLLNRNWDIKGRRVINAGDPKALQDYVTLGYLQGRLPTIISGTLNPSQLPSNAIEGDLFVSTDFNHIYRYNGTGWVRVCCASDIVVHSRTDPGVGYHLLDGATSVRISLNDGTTTLIDLPDELTDAPVSRTAHTAYNGPSSSPPVAPTLSGALANESTHTHSIEHNHDAFDSAGPDTTEEVDNDLVVSTVQVASATHIHTIDVPTFSGDSGAGTAHTHGLGTVVVSDTTRVREIEYLPYIRL